MDLKSATQRIADYLKEVFGRVVELREVAVERSASGRIWMGTVYCVTRLGDVEVGKVGVTENGSMVGGLGVDDLVTALGRIANIGGFEGTPSTFPDQAEDDFSSLSADGPSELDDFKVSVRDSEDAELDDFFSEMGGADIKGDIIGLLTSGREEDLLKARRLMPKLLVFPDNRGAVLRQMGELELRLGETGIGLNYLEAAAREFADLADIPSLEQTVVLVATAISEEALENHPASMLLRQTRSRLSPLKSLSEVPAFSGLGQEALDLLINIADLVTAEPGEAILKEGAPAVAAYVVKSGILSVSLEEPGGGSRVVRCCFPGELVGESSVLEGESELWRFDGTALKQIIQKATDLKAGIEAKRTLHRLDSFFSMNRATSTLDVRVRDKLLGCIEAIRYAREGEILESKDVLPDSVYLVVDGRLEYQRPGVAPRVYEIDAFACLRDSLHELPLEGNLVAAAPSRLVTFDPETLRALAKEAPPEVVAVLERLD
jgi:CRP-like cAMP-binding protein